MADRSKIEWTDATWNPIRARNKATGKIGWHCEHASPGCANCYSESFNADRLGTRLPFKPGHRAKVEIFLDPDMLLQPLRWRRTRMIFVCSMTDLFADFVPDAFIDQIFAVMALCPQHTFQVLTKRSSRMRAYIDQLSTPADPLDVRVFSPEKHVIARLWKAAQELNWFVDCPGDGCYLPTRWAGWPLPNVWLGVSTEDQRRADERVPDLLATPAAVRFVSAEPLLGPVDLTKVRCPNGCVPPDYCNRCHPDGGRPTGLFSAFGGGTLDWVIVGGESGRAARSMHPDWARGLRNQCKAEGTSFFFKQWGEWAPSTEAAAYGNPRSGWRSMRAHTDGLPKRDDLYPEAGAAFIAHVGKRAAGRLLDGVEHNGMPAIAADALASDARFGPLPAPPTQIEFA